MRRIPLLLRPLCQVLLAASAVATLAAPANAAELVIRVSGLAEPRGQIGCSLFAGPQGFPMDNSAARVQWLPTLPADASSASCRFADVPPGKYAVSIGHDMNGNRRVDTNIVGMPTEQWGVSNNVRPTLRAPRFDEAVFVVPEQAGEHVIDIRVAK